MTNIWFTSDTHFGHKLMLGKDRVRGRPWQTVEEMDEGLVAMWNARVKSEDTVYHLGDFSFHKSGATMEIVKRLNGHVHLVRGNHDKSLNQYILAQFETVSELKEVRVGDKRIICCHFALMTWDKMYKGSWMLHGHSHGALALDLTKRRLDVGVDVPGSGYGPWNYDTIAFEMEKYGFEPVDHHGQRYDGDEADAT